MRNRNIAWAGLVTAGGALGLAGQVLGETAGAEGLEEIVVTAQKRSENLQNVPIAVSVVSGAAIADQQITNVQGLANTLPNVQINSFSNSPDSAVFTIRGVGVNDADPYVGTTVSVVVDGVVVGVNTSALLSLFDIDHIEVLRGPQGTLFGANTTGGVVNVVTRQPTGAYDGELQVTGGNYGRLDVNAAVNVPITDELSGKVSILHSGHDGYFTNSVNGTNLGQVDITALRAYLKYQPTDVYSATLITEYDRSRNGSQTGVNFSDSSQLLSIPGFTNGPIRYVRGQTADLPNLNDRNTYSVTLTQNLKSRIGDIVSITNYRKYDSTLYSDDDGTGEQWLQTRRASGQHQVSEELRTNVDLTDRARLIVGAFGLYQKYFLDQSTELDGFLRGLGQPQTQRQSSTSLSAFSQLYYDLTDRLRLQVGVRYANESTRATSTTANTFTATPGALSTFSDPLIPGSFISASGSKTWNNIGDKIGLDYRIDPNIMLYGYYARGFKSGGFTGRIAVAQDIGPFNPEHLDTFEVGVKADLLDRRLRVNMAAFYNIYKDMQVTQNITYLSGANSASIANAGKAITKGVELEATAAPLGGLLLSAGVAYLDAYYTRYDTQVLDAASGLLVPVSYAGTALMNAPRWSGNASASYAVKTGPGKTAVFAQYTFSSSKFSNFDDLPQERVGSIGLFNATLTWSPDSERWSAGLYGRNLANKYYYAQKLYLPGTFAVAALGAPREYGIDLRYKW